MNESIHLKMGISDALVGFFGPHPLTQEISLQVDLAWSYSDERRDFCMFEKLDCSSQADTEETSSESSNQLECPDFNKNRHCGKFEWDEYHFTKDQLERKYCIAWSTISSKDSHIPREVALHDRNSCGDFGSTRLWFRTSDKEEMFNSLIDQLKSRKICQYELFDSFNNEAFNHY